MGKHGLTLAAVVTLALVPTTSDAFTTQLNLAKYRKLRARLTTEFTVVGSGRGYSQPCPERMENIGLMKWGDGTIALGYYIGVLATEHYMLSTPWLFPGYDGGDPNALTKTRDELYYALLAMERLDNDADAAFPAPCSQTPSLNGFFLRDDVPADFYTHFPGMTVVESDYIDPTLTNKEESQDQLYHVQHGLALVLKLVPNGVIVQGKELRSWALEQATRIVRHIGEEGSWRIRNPACDDRLVNRGDNGIAYSFGEAMAANFLTDGTYTPATDAFWETIWNTLDSPTNPAYMDEDNLHMSMAIMAVGDGYGPDTAMVMRTLMDVQDWPVYPLLNRVLHPENQGFCSVGREVNERARIMLDEMPDEPDPQCPGASGPATYGWTVHNRFIRGKSQHYVGPTGCENIHFHGLDYMLLHNLYAIGSPLTWNGDPLADPCGVVPDGPSAGGDGGRGGDGGGGGDDASGCCDAGSPAPASPLLALGVAGLLVRRRRRR